MYTIQSDKLAAVALAVSIEKARYYLQGVFVEATPANVTMTATNGHILLTARQNIETPDAVPFSIIIPSETIALALKAKTPDLALSVDGEGYKIGNISFKPIDGTFPDWRRVVPAATPEKPSIDGFWFQSVYLATMAKAAKLLGWRNATAEGFFVYPNAGSPALVQFLNNENVVGVVMPVRAPRDAFAMPAWAHI